MAKRLVSLFLTVVLCFSATSCAFVEWIERDMHGEMSLYEGGVIYKGQKYISTNSIFNIELETDDVKLGWVYNFPFNGTARYYSYTAENPLYIFCCTTGDYASKVYLREDFDYEKESFVLEGTETEIKLAEAFVKSEHELEANLLDKCQISLYLKDEPRLKADIYCHWSEGKWFFRSGGECYVLSDELAEILADEGFVKPNVAEKADTIGLQGADKLRPDYNLGNCKNLMGDVSVILLYMNDFESGWTGKEMAEFQEKEVEPAFDFIEKQAKEYGVDVNFTIRQYDSLYYNGEVLSGSGYVSTDVLEQAAKGLNYSSAEEMREALKLKCGTGNLIFITVFDKYGVPYGLNPRRGSDMDLTEHCVIFTSDFEPQFNGYYASEIVFCTLCLYGAENLQASMWRKSLAASLYAKDVMYGRKSDINDNNIGDATAFYIGWLNVPPNVMCDENW